jgi:hypothetical protein
MVMKVDFMTPGHIIKIKCTSFEQTGIPFIRKDLKSDYWFWRS